MGMTRKEFEVIADIVASGDKLALASNHQAQTLAAYYKHRLITDLCEKHGHNFNVKMFQARLKQIEKELEL